MNKPILRIHDYLDHILQAICRINRYVQGISEESFLTDEEKQDAVIRNIEVIGEAARNLERNFQDFAEQHSDVPWSDIYLMRNRLSHGYFSVDIELVWNTVKRDIPELEKQIKNLQKEIV
ncbi:MAG: DUF86 domain-containing protein [Candidatus Riflebacteria bacterium]|nr:DUF86 domain-containing protein [Candidatus Riflebacteria bacterium]